MAWNRQRAWKTFGLWLGLAALMVQAVAPLCAAGRVSTGADGSSAIVLCTAHGLETIRIGADGRPLQDAPAEDHHASCFLCVSCPSANATPTPSFIGIAAPATGMGAPAIAAAAPAISLKLHFSYVSRAPPASASIGIA